MMMWNPPWLLALFSPLLSFAFTNSAKVWSVSNVVAYLSAAVITLASTETAQKKRIQLLVTCTLFTLCFPPIWMCLKLGQIAGFLTVGLSLFLFGIKRQKRVSLGLFSISLTRSTPLYGPARPSRLVASSGEAIFLDYTNPITAPRIDRSYGIHGTELSDFMDSRGTLRSTHYRIWT